MHKANAYILVHNGVEREVENVPSSLNNPHTPAFAFIHSFFNLLSTHYVPGTVPDAGNTKMKRRVSPRQELYALTDTGMFMFADVGYGTKCGHIRKKSVEVCLRIQEDSLH